MKKKKQNNIGEFDLNLDFDLNTDFDFNMEIWEEQDLKQGRSKENLHLNKGRTKENFHLKLKKDSFNRERTERKATI